MSEQIALCAFAAMRPQIGKLIKRLHTFHHDHLFEAIAERYQAFEDCSVGCGSKDAANEGAINLYNVNRIISKMEERSVSGAEIIHGDPHAF